jgi:hypothetical protein
MTLVRPDADHNHAIRENFPPLFCLATDGLTLLPMTDPLWPRAELDRLDLLTAGVLTAGVLTAGPPQNQFSVRLADA